MEPAIEISVERAMEIPMKAVAMTEIIKVMEIMEAASIREKAPAKPAGERKEKWPKGSANPYRVTTIKAPIDIHYCGGRLAITRINVCVWRRCRRRRYCLRIIGSSSRLLWIVVGLGCLGGCSRHRVLAQFSTALQHRADDRGGNSVVAKFYNLVRAGIKRPGSVFDVGQHYGFIDTGVRQFDHIVNAAGIRGGSSARQRIYAGIRLNSGGGLQRPGRKPRAGKDPA
jgi:hypothetical protein